MIEIPTVTKGEPVRRYPAHVFHPHIRSMIQELQIHGFNDEMIGSTILSILSAAIGKSYKIAGFEPNHEEPAILWIVLVAKSGYRKSAIIKQLLKPFRDKHWQNINEYETARDEFEADENKASLKRPKKTEILIKGFTIEGVVKAAYNTPKGSLIHSDEFLSFMQNLNKYNKGNDIDIILGFHDGDGYSSTLATKDGYNVKETNFNILGGIQWRRIPQLLHKDNLNSGLAHRILFAAPEMTLPDPVDIQSDENVRTRYNQIIEKLMEIEPDQGVLKLTPEAKNRLFTWLCENNSRINRYNESGNILSEVYSKAAGMMLRIALVLQVSSDICEDQAPDQVSSDSLTNAFEMIDFYIENTKKVYGINDLPSELIGKPDWQVKLYSRLPDEFTTHQALETCELHQLPAKERTIKDFIANPKLFKRLAQGKYEKVSA